MTVDKDPYLGRINPKKAHEYNLLVPILLDEWARFFLNIVRKKNIEAALTLRCYSKFQLTESYRIHHRILGLLRCESDSESSIDLSTPSGPRY